jgi:hypothetical protein
VLPLKKLSGIASTTFQPKNKNKIPMKFEYYERKLRLSNRSWQRETTFCWPFKSTTTRIMNILNPVICRTPMARLITQTRILLQKNKNLKV